MKSYPHSYEMALNMFRPHIISVGSEWTMRQCIMRTGNECRQ